MKNRKYLFAGTALLIAFIVWTILIQSVDVQAVGVNGTKIGFLELIVKGFLIIRNSSKLTFTEDENE